MAGKKKESAIVPQKWEDVPEIPKEDQPYPLPAGWKWVRLINVINYIKAGGDKPDDFQEKKDNKNKIPVIANGLENEGIIGYTKYSKNYENTLTIAARGTIGFPFLRDYDYFPVVRLIVISPNTSLILAKFLYYIFFVFPEKGTGSSIPQLTVPKLKEKIIPLCSTKKQQIIVSYIESLFSKLDEAAEKVQAVIDSHETRKQAILHKAFSGELTRKWREENGVSLDSWEEKTLQEVCIIPITDGTHQTPTYSDKSNGIPFLSSKDVAKEYIDWDNIKYITKELHDLLYKRIAPKKGDILLAKNGTTGIAALVTEEKVFDIYVTLALLRPNINIVNKNFLLYIINSPICKFQFDNRLTGIGVPNLHLRDIKEVSFQIPTLEEQNQIVHIINTNMEKLKVNLKICSIIFEKIKYVKSQILRLSFSGEL